MICPKCHRDMTLIRFIADTGTGESEHQYRCVHCWNHVTVRKTRKQVSG